MYRIVPRQLEFHEKLLHSSDCRIFLVRNLVAPASIHTMHDENTRMQLSFGHCSRLFSVTCRMRSTGGSCPVKSLNWAAACPTNISRPLIAVLPACLASWGRNETRGSELRANSEEDSYTPQDATSEPHAAPHLQQLCLQWCVHGIEHDFKVAHGRCRNRRLADGWVHAH